MKMKLEVEIEAVDTNGEMIEDPARVRELVTMWLNETTDTVLEVFGGETTDFQGTISIGSNFTLAEG